MTQDVLAEALRATYDDGDGLGYRLVLMDESGGVIPTTLPDTFIEAIRAALVRTPETLGAGHRTREPHDCFLMNCRDLGDEVERLQGRLAVSPAPDPGAGPDTLRRAVVAAASIFLVAHDRVVDSTTVTRDDTFAMKNAADNLRDVLREYALDPLPQWPDGPVPTAVQNAWNEAHLAAEDAAPSAEPPETETP